MFGRSRLIVAVLPLLLLAVAASGIVVEGDVAELLAVTTPGTLLLLPLALGCSLGGRDLRCLLRSDAWVRAPGTGVTLLVVQSALPRGGTLVARSLAERGPPTRTVRG